MFGVELLTGSPGFSRCLLAGFLAYRIWLSLVLCHASMNAPVNTIRILFIAAVADGGQYKVMSGRIGLEKTAGRGCVEPLGLPSAEAMLTVGR